MKSGICMTLTGIIFVFIFAYLADYFDKNDELRWWELEGFPMEDACLVFIFFSGAVVMTGVLILFVYTVED